MNTFMDQIGMYPSDLKLFSVFL